MVDVSDLFGLAVLHHQSGQNAQAELYYRQILAIDPDNIGTLNNLGLIVSPQEAYGLFERAVQLKPDYLDAQINFGRMLRAFGHMDQAIECYQRIIELAPDSGGAHFSLAHVYLAQNRHDQAIASLEEAVRCDPYLLQAQGLLRNLRARKCVAQMETDIQMIATAHFRPLRADQMGLGPDVPTGQRIAMVMQGPLQRDFDFTVESVKIYRKIFPEVQVVLSTWEGEDAASLDEIRNAGAVVLLNAPPSHRGPGNNINMQVCSAAAGVLWAKANGYDYCLKTRTDFRIFNPSLFVDCLTLQQAFPLTHSYPQSQRLVAFSNHVKYMPYTLPDVTMFGAIDDMVAYWTPPYDDRTEFHFQTLMQLAKSLHAEAWFLIHYAGKLGRPVQWSLQDYWEIIKDHFVFMDSPAADIYWRKAPYTEYRWKLYEASSNFETFGFAEWLRLYTGLYPVNADPRIADRPGATAINDILRG